MPDPYPNTRLRFTDSALNILMEQQIDASDALHVVRNYQFTSPGRRSRQFWYQGVTPQGRELKVLIQEETSYDALIIIVTEVSQGGV